jgi:hypothetical protein
MRLSRLVSAELLKNPNVRLVAQPIGRAEQSDDTAGVHYSEIHVDLKPLDGPSAELTRISLRPGASVGPPRMRVPPIEFNRCGSRERACVFRSRVALGRRPRRDRRAPQRIRATVQ